MSSGLLYLLALNLLQANSLPVCAANSKFKDLPSLVTKIAEYDSADRKVDKDYAKAHKEPVEKIRARYAPTGEFHCENGNAKWGGQVTLRDNLVTTSAHGFINDDCTQAYPDLSVCRFVLTVDGKEKEFELAKVEAHGYFCDRKPFKSKDDWAIVRLKERVPAQIKPYRIDKDVTARAVGKRVVAVGRSSDFYHQVGNKLIFPKHYADCDYKEKLAGREAGTMATNCDGAERASGSSLLAENVDDPVLIGVNSGGSETHQQLEQAWKSHRPNKGKYDPLDWASYFTPVSGEFYDVLSTF